jgi:hypothetical protein
MDEHKIRTEYVNRDRQVISDVVNRIFAIRFRYLLITK